MAGQYRVSGAVFENTRNGPKYSGFIEIDGVKTFIALWPKVSAKGDDYLQVAEDRKPDKKPGANTGAPAAQSPFKPRGGQAPARPAPRATGTSNLDLDDDIPF